jgi:hypothetical protein
MQSKAITTPQSTIDRVTRDLADLADRQMVAETVALISASCARRSDLDEIEAELRIRQFHILLAGYPRSVLAELAHPQLGIVGESVFLPTVAELKKFSDKLVQYRLDTRRRAEETRAAEAEANAEREWEAKRPPASERAAHVDAVLAKVVRGISAP